MSDAASRLPWLSDAEVDDLCDGLTQKAAMMRYLKDELKLPVKAKPNGRPLVPRAAFEDLFPATPGELRKMAGPPAQGAQPNEQALLRAISRS